MSAKHTPGPWAASSKDASTIKPASDFLGESNVLIAKVHGHENSGFFPSIEEQEANTQLIAAAPELLAALQDYLTADEIADGYGLGIGGDFRQKAWAAFAKATGEKA